MSGPPEEQRPATGPMEDREPPAPPSPVLLPERHAGARGTAKRMIETLVPWLPYFVAAAGAAYLNENILAVFRGLLST